MDPDQFADGSSPLRAHRVCLIKLSEVQLKICTSREMHMHFSVHKMLVGYGV